VQIEEIQPKSPEVQIVENAGPASSPTRLINLVRAGAKRVRISPKRAGPPSYLRPGEQRITSFFGKVSPRTAAARVLARAQKDTIEDVQCKARAALAALDVEAAKQKIIADRVAAKRRIRAARYNGPQTAKHQVPIFLVMASLAADNERWGFWGCPMSGV
jgi:hypothetical protein